MTKKIQKIICLLALASGVLPVGVVAPSIWDFHKAPARFSSIMLRSLTGGASGMLVAGVLALATQGQKRNHKTIGAAALLGAAVCGGLTYVSNRNNTPEMWLTQFFEKFNEISSHVALARSEMSNPEWVQMQGSLEDLEQLLRLLRKVCSDIPKLQRVADILISLGLDEFRPETLVDLRANKEQLIELQHRTLTRCAWIATTVDYENFQRLYARVSQASVLASSVRDEWMRNRIGVRSFKHLKQELTDLTTSFACIDAIMGRLQSPESALILNAQQQLVVAQALSCVEVLRERCDARLAFVSARADYQDFNELYQVCVQDPVLQVSGIFGDDDAWFMLNGVQRNLSEVSRDLRRRKMDMQTGIELAQRLLKASVAVHFSVLECSEINGKSLVLRDLTALCNERQRMITGLQKIEDFVVGHTHGLANRLAQESSFGPSDLSWMQFSRNSEWPLQDVCDRLRTLKAELARTLSQGESLTRSSDLSRLSESRKNMVKSRIERLKRAMNLVDQRLTFVLHSTMYAEEVAKKRSLETARQEQLERERRAREEAATRAIEERARQRELYRQAQEQRATAPVGKGVQDSVPSVPPVEPESCFCGDDITVGQEYVLSCSCKDSFYHQDCISRWVNSSKTCPTCRARVTSVDIKKYEKPQPVIVPTAPPMDVRPGQQAAPVVPPVSTRPVSAEGSAPVQPTVAPVAPQPQAVVAQPEQADECYLCMDSDNIADSTTTNCDCTVKVPACRECLQAWLAARHTCPRCQKTGATLVPYIKA